FAFVQGIEGTLEIFASANSIAIKPCDSGLREHAVEKFFQFFGARADEIDVFAAAVHADFRDRSRVSAVVALHAAVAFVVSHCDGAVLAFKTFAAATTKSERRISTTVEQYHDLLFSVETIFDFTGQLTGNYLFVSRLLELLPHIDGFNFREWAFL